jgi:hypothetical protein
MQPLTQVPVYTCRYGGTSLGRAGDWTSSGRKNPKIAARGRAPKSDSGLSYGDHNHRGNSSSAGMQPQQQRTRAERALSLVGGSAAAAASGGASSSRGGGVRGSSRTKMGNNSAANDDRSEANKNISALLSFFLLPLNAPLSLHWL